MIVRFQGLIFSHKDRHPYFIIKFRFLKTLKTWVALNNLFKIWRFPKMADFFQNREHLRAVDSRFYWYLLSSGPPMHLNCLYSAYNPLLYLNIILVYNNNFISVPTIPTQCHNDLYSLSFINCIGDHEIAPSDMW